MTQSMSVSQRLQIVVFLKVFLFINISQGTLIRRHRIPKSASKIGQHFMVTDFNVGVEVTFYSRTFKIVGCDEFTRVSH